jgi:hypothetical protein
MEEVDLVNRAKIGQEENEKRMKTPEIKTKCV